MEITVKKIGKLSPLSKSFIAYEGCTLYSVQLVSPIDLEVTRFISWSSHDSFKCLSPSRKLRALFNNELNKDDLSLILSEYKIEKICEDGLSADSTNLSELVKL